MEAHCRDLFRVVLSIKVGKILPSTLLSKRSNNSKENTLYEASRELGRFIRTL
ncbi:transposase [Bacillus cereus]|nr:transposase [Bacillus cereus]MCI4057338.1 transposase [Bacillus cereus]MCM3328019.1 transposase [Bacillus cereus]